MAKRQITYWKYGNVFKSNMISILQTLQLVLNMCSLTFPVQVV